VRPAYVGGGLAKRPGQDTCWVLCWDVRAGVNAMASNNGQSCESIFAFLKLTFSRDFRARNPQKMIATLAHCDKAATSRCPGIAHPCFYSPPYCWLILSSSPD
jgi:hypothetical protein